MESNDNDNELIGCEMDNDDVVKFVNKCEAEGSTIPEKIESIIRFFLAKGDNHLLRTVA